MPAEVGALAPARHFRVEFAVALALVWGLVLARSLVYLLYPHASFDSDQAVTGLMAKHLSEGRSFPLFMYGQPYMLAVEAWLTVPYFWIAGPTAVALRASIIGLNFAVATLLLFGLSRGTGLRPLFAAVAVTFFAFVPPDTAANIVDAGGGTIEQFVWVAVLWLVRSRPFLLGALLAIAFLNREFTVYVVPVLVAGQVWSGAWRRRETWQAWLFALVTFFAVWQSVQALKPVADLMGPGTRGMASRVQADSQLGNLAQRLRVEPLEVPVRVVTLMRETVLGWLGGRPVVTALATQGHTWMGWLLATAGLAAGVRIVWLSRRGERPLVAAAMGWYLLGVGLMSVVGYALTRPAFDVTPRYLVLSILIPVGLSAIWLTLEPSRIVRGLITAVVMVWAVAAGADNWRQWDRYASGRERDGMRELIAALDARSVIVAEADYWRAYKLTFLSQERIKVASTDVVRILEYQSLANAARPNLVRLEHRACPGGEEAGGMYICGGR